MSLKRSLLKNKVPKNNLRIIITRHGERADLAIGPNWTAILQNPYDLDRRISYLTPRPNLYEWGYDPPLTITGERQSKYVGQKLQKLGYTIDYCYSSPAYRSVQTANKILEGQGHQQAIPINIDHGLFECPSWYQGIPFYFVPVEYISSDGYFNINPQYAPVYHNVKQKEDENGFYERSRRFTKTIVKQHIKQGGTILLCGHAGSIEVLTRGLLDLPARPERLQYEAGRVNYCDYTILERDRYTGQWFLPPGSNQHYYTRPQELLHTIPVYHATSQNLQSNALMETTYPTRISMHSTTGTRNPTRRSRRRTSHPPGRLTYSAGGTVHPTGILY